MKFRIGLMFLAAFVEAQQPSSVWEGVYIQEQASGGKVIYDQQCSGCHGVDIAKARAGGSPMLTGDQFKENWNGLSVGELFEYVKKSMPRNDAGHLTPGQTANVVAFIFSSNGFPAGAKELSTDPAALKAIRIEAAKSKQALF